MQCVILAAGKGTRMLPLTEHLPKPLIKVCGKPLIEHIVAALPTIVTELIIVVGYKGEQIRDYCGSEYLGRKVQYVTQENYAGGTGDALRYAKDLVTGKFLFMYADDIHGDAALAAAVEEEHAMLGAYSDTPERFGVLVTDAAGNLIEILEKPANPPSNTVNIGGFVLTPEIFSYEAAVSEVHGEVLVTDMITAYAAEHPVKVITQDLWIPVGRPEDIATAEALLCPDSVEKAG